MRPRRDDAPGASRLECLPKDILDRVVDLPKQDLHTAQVDLQHLGLASHTLQDKLLNPATLRWRKSSRLASMARRLVEQHEASFLRDWAHAAAITSVFPLLSPLKRERHLERVLSEPGVPLLCSLVGALQLLSSDDQCRVVQALDRSGDFHEGICQFAQFGVSLGIEAQRQLDDRILQIDEPVTFVDALWCRTNYWREPDSETCDRMVSKSLDLVAPELLEPALEGLAPLLPHMTGPFRARYMDVVSLMLPGEARADVVVRAIRGMADTADEVAARLFASIEELGSPEQWHRAVLAAAGAVGAGPIPDDWVHLTFSRALALPKPQRIFALVAMAPRLSRTGHPLVASLRRAIHGAVDASPDAATLAQLAAGADLLDDARLERLVDLVIDRPDTEFSAMALTGLAGVASRLCHDQMKRVLRSIGALNLVDRRGAVASLWASLPGLNRDLQDVALGLLLDLLPFDPQRVLMAATNSGWAGSLTEAQLARVVDAIEQKLPPHECCFAVGLVADNLWKNPT